MEVNRISTYVKKYARNRLQKKEKIFYFKAEKSVFELSN